MAGVLQSLLADALAAVLLTSNVDQAFDTSKHLGFDQAQAFTTGSNAGGYTVNSVEVNARLNSRTNIPVSVNKNNNGSPGTSLGTLTNPTWNCSFSQLRIHGRRNRPGGEHDLFRRGG